VGSHAVSFSSAVASSIKPPGANSYVKCFHPLAAQKEWLQVRQVSGFIFCMTSITLGEFQGNVTNVLPLLPGPSSQVIVHFIFCFTFLSVPLLCRCFPTLFLFCYMFLPSPLQSAVINALLTRCLSHYLYLFYLSINTTTLDVLRLAFAI
jgi:hypothetical protein